MTLRPYQEQLIQATRAEMARGSKSVLVTSPTGSGKTKLTVHMLGEAARNGKRCWFVVHRRELVKQSLRAFSDEGITCGVMATGFIAEPKHAIQICGVGAIKGRRQDYPAPDLVVWDECHHITAKTWALLKASLPGFHVGLTATPERLDGRGLGEHFSRIVLGPKVKWLIQQGFLSPYRMFSTPGIDVRGIKTQAGDYSKKQLGLAADKPTITGDAVKHYQRLAPGQQAVAFAVSIEHSKHIVATFQAAGISAAHIDGDTDGRQRDRDMERFKSGQIQVLSNVDLFGEGVDVPGIGCAILLRPTQSLGLYLQQVGRALRPAVGKTEAIILDHAGNAGRHGLPDDEREWSLAGRERGTKRGADSEVKCRVCPRCFAAQPPAGPTCAYCGAEFGKTEREIKQIEGELEEVRRVDRRKEIGRARTSDDLLRIAKERGYSPQWAVKLMAARQRA